MIARTAPWPGLAVCGAVVRPHRRAILALAIAAALSLTPAMAAAHHILGIPHYAYDEQYPQVPILTYVTELGPYEVRMTGYPGIPQPGERCTLHAIIRDKVTAEPYTGEVRLEVLRQALLSSDSVVYGPVTAGLEENVFKFYPELEAEANYVIRLTYEAEGVPWVIDLPLVVGEPGSPWKLLGAGGGGLIVFLVVIRAIRIKRRRRQTPAAQQAYA